MSDARLKVIETFNDYPLDKKSAFRIFLGRNIPNQNLNEIQLIVTDEELVEFFDTQEELTGLTRFDCDGMWEGDTEQSIMVIAFAVTLRQVLNFGFDYMETFSQHAVYIEFCETKTFEYFRSEGRVTTN
jgi:hypothetical protein